MGLLITLLLVVLFFRVFVGISVGLFKLLLGIVVVLTLLSIAPIGLALVGLLVPILLLVALFSVVGFVLRMIF